MDRRGVMALGAGALAAPLAAPMGRAAGAPSGGGLAERLELAYRSGVLRGLHAVCLSKAGTPVVEQYYGGQDQDWGRPLGEVSFGPETLHDLRSVSKSIVSLLYAIALRDGLVPAPEAPLLQAFPQYSDLARDPQRATWTVSHVLNMSLGTEWNEDLPYSDPNNSEIQMELAEDRYRYVLDRPIAHPAGARWRYNGGCSALLGHLIATGTGMDLPEYARKVLFDPLGLGSTYWTRGQDGVPSAASGLRMTAPDLLRIGEMMLAGGRWGDRQVVPESWIARCSTPVLSTGFLDYSHQWYVSSQAAAGHENPVRMISAMGNGGQRLYLLPDLDLAAVVFAGNYNRPDQWMTPTLVLQRLILAQVL